VEPVPEDEKARPGRAPRTVALAALPAVEQAEGDPGLADAGVVDARPEGRQAQGVERPSELSGRASPLSPAEVGGHRLEGKGDVALSDLTALAPARAGPHNHLEGERAERGAGIDALDEPELVGGVEKAHQLPTARACPRGGAPEALAGEVGLHAGSIGRQPERPRRGGGPLCGRCGAGRPGERRGGCLARLRPRQAAPEQRPKGGVLRRGRLRRPIHRPARVRTG
jgi:hypothetical protein